MAQFKRKIRVANPQRKRTAKRKRATAKPRHRSARRKAPKAAAKAANPKEKPRMARKRKASRRKRRNPVVAARATNRRRRAVARPRHRRRRNPTGRISSKATGLFSDSATALVALVATRQLPQFVLKEANTGIWGYLANCATAGATAYAANRFMGERAGNAALIGGGLYVVNRILTEKVSPIGQYLSLSGVGDPAAATNLGVIRDGYFIHPTVMDEQGRPIIPQEIINARGNAQTLPAGGSMQGAWWPQVPDRFASRF